MAGSVHKGTFTQANRATATAGTAIIVTIPTKFYGARTRVTQLMYLAGATAHLLTFMKPLNRVNTTQAQAANDTSLTLSSISRIGANMGNTDYVIVQHSDGSFGTYAVSAVNTTTKVVTISALSAAVANNAMVWLLGTLTSTPHVTMQTVASVLNQFRDSVSGLACTGYKTVVSGTTYQRSGNDDPMAIYSPNTTNAGVFESVSGHYGNP